MQVVRKGSSAGLAARAMLVTAALLLSTSAQYSQEPASSAPQAAEPGISTKIPGPGEGGEDWNKLSIAGQPLKVSPPLVGPKADRSTYSMELLRVQWRPDDAIDLYVIKPLHVVKPPVVLYLYSYPSETDRFRDPGYCQRVTADGVAAVGFVSALTGQRYHSRPMKEWFVSELPEALGKSVHDVQMVIDYLETRGDLDTSRLGIFGTGSGATIAILTASVDPRLQMLDLLDPWCDWSDWMAKSAIIPEKERPNYVTPEFQKKIAAFDPIKVLPTLKTQHIRLQHVLDDDVTPEACKHQLEAVAPATVDVVRFNDTPAFFKVVGGGHAFDWIKDQLKAMPPAKTAERYSAAPGRPAAKSRGLSNGNSQSEGRLN